MERFSRMNSTKETRSLNKPRVKGSSHESQHCGSHLILVILRRWEASYSNVGVFPILLMTFFYVSLNLVVAYFCIYLWVLWMNYRFLTRGVWGPPESGWVPVWQPGLRAPVRPGTGSAGNAGAELAVADWSRWSEASWFSCLFHLDEAPGYQSRTGSRDLADVAEETNQKEDGELWDNHV